MKYLRTIFALALGGTASAESNECLPPEIPDPLELMEQVEQECFARGDVIRAGAGRKSDASLDGIPPAWDVRAEVDETQEDFYGSRYNTGNLWPQNPHTSVYDRVESHGGVLRPMQCDDFEDGFLDGMWTRDIRPSPGDPLDPIYSSEGDGEFRHTHTATMQGDLLYTAIGLDDYEASWVMAKDLPDGRHTGPMYAFVTDGDPLGGDVGAVEKIRVRLGTFAPVVSVWRVDGLGNLVEEASWLLNYVPYYAMPHRYEIRVSVRRDSSLGVYDVVVEGEFEDGSTSKAVAIDFADIRSGDQPTDRIVFGTLETGAGEDHRYDRWDDFCLSERMPFGVYVSNIHSSTHPDGRFRSAEWEATGDVQVDVRFAARPDLLDAATWIPIDSGADYDELAPFLQYRVHLNAPTASLDRITLNVWAPVGSKGMAPLSDVVQTLPPGETVWVGVDLALAAPLLLHTRDSGGPPYIDSGDGTLTIRNSRIDLGGASRILTDYTSASPFHANNRVFTIVVEDSTVFGSGPGGDLFPIPTSQHRVAPLTVRNSTLHDMRRIGDIVRIDDSDVHDIYGAAVLGGREIPFTEITANRNHLWNMWASNANCFLGRYASWNWCQDTPHNGFSFIGAASGDGTPFEYVNISYNLVDNAGHSSFQVIGEEFAGPPGGPCRSTGWDCPGLDNGNYALMQGNVALSGNYITAQFASSGANFHFIDNCINHDKEDLYAPGIMTQSYRVHDYVIRGNKVWSRNSQAAGMNIIAHTYGGLIEDNIVITGRGPALYMSFLATDLAPGGSQNLVFRNNYWGGGLDVPRQFLFPAQGTLSLEATADARFYGDTIATLYDVPDIGLADCCYQTQSPFYDVNVFPDGKSLDVEVRDDLTNQGNFLRFSDTTRVFADQDTTGQVEFALDPSEDFAVALTGGVAEFPLLARQVVVGSDQTYDAVARLLFPPGTALAEVVDLSTGAGVPIAINGAEFSFPLEGRHCYEITFDLNRPPDCSQAAPTVAAAWPPNHRFVTVGIVGVTDPDGDAVSIAVDRIRQDEPVNEKGDGSTGPDGMGMGGSQTSLRAERSGRGDGRVYHVFFTAGDGRGRTCVGEVKVGVPRDQNKNRASVDGGALYDSSGS